MQAHHSLTRLHAHQGPSPASCSVPALRVRRTCRLAARVAASDPAAPKPDPFAEKKIYNDGPFDKFFIKIYTEKMAAQLKGVPVPAAPQYDDFVRVSKEIMRGRTPAEQKAVVLNVLASLLPPQATTQFRKLFPPTQMSAELNALFATQGFGWLVGEMELKEGDVVIGPGQVRKQKSIVQIKKCRYLEASGCVGMCVNMCKIPTQSFFTDDFGLPLTMKPNFDDLSCQMIFGQPPEPETVDAAFQQPCFKVQCAMSEPTVAKPCVKLPQVTPAVAPVKSV